MSPGISRYGLLVLLSWLWVTPALACEKVRVCVVSILASERDDKIDPKLVYIARELKKMNPKLKGFRLGPISSKSVAIGVKDRYELIEKQMTAITIVQGANEDDRILLKVTPPKMGEITYDTVCGKFLPILTGFRDKNGDMLIIAIRVQPCHGK
jgi:hypothetical protein